MADQPIPLYDQHAELVAWRVGDHFYTPDLNWVAFVHDGNAFAARIDSTWLGPVSEGLAMDRSGRVVLWAADARVVGQVAPYAPARANRPPRPERPPRPYLPPRPYKPPRPSDGWSHHTFESWIAGGVQREAQPDEVAGLSPNEIEFDEG